MPTWLSCLEKQALELQVVGSKQGEPQANAATNAKDQLIQNLRDSECAREQQFHADISTLRSELPAAKWQLEESRVVEAQLSDKKAQSDYKRLKEEMEARLLESSSGLRSSRRRRRN
ncbi:hypothetical protein CLOM_g24531 [Closterium sp. NIES-68]|nr:hypothetical protein CLOM_g24531 [Closterium sp. NIES-68]GJP61368.1 hypothetical protein CLOP_g18539 [Closterium sp. NIES-67]